MLTLPRSVRIFLSSGAQDMRKSIDGLRAIVEYELEGDAYSGHLFVFVSRRGDRVKVLTWDATIAKLHLLEAVRKARRSRCQSIRSEVFHSR